MRFKTTGGQFVTAATRAEAAALAAQYGFGEIAGAAAAPAKAAALRPIGLWDDQSQSWVFGPSADYSSMSSDMEEYRTEGYHGCLMATSTKGWPVRPTAAEMAAFHLATK